jgi:CO dehydrogenase/acetyl-CoA synthase epsilon subunit
MMNKPQDTYKIEVEIAKGELPDLISKLYGEFELPAIKTAGDKDRILIQHMKEIFENFRGEPFIAYI